MLAFFHGFVLAFGLILPLGVQNVFIFNQGAVQPRFIKAFPAVLTATVCDATLITLAVMGVSVMVLTVSYLKYALLVIGILFLIYMGIVTWRTQGEDVQENQERMSAKKQVLFASSVSLFNPHAILDTIGVIGASSVQYQGSDKFWFAFAGILVSFVWFVFFSCGRWLPEKTEVGRYSHF